MAFLLCAVVLVNILTLERVCTEKVCYKDGLCSEDESDEKRYLLYDVNPGEGFNLRRDVYMRVAAAVKQLNDGGRHRWTLVLPPWGPLYHWQVTHGEDESGIPWSRFFDVPSLSKYVPVIDFHQYVGDVGAQVDLALQLQDYAEGWTDGNFEEKWHVRPCIRKARFRQFGEAYRTRFGTELLRAENFSCVSIQGTSRTLAQLLRGYPHRSFLVDRAEAVLHDYYGGGQFWAARRSMRFADQLTVAAAALRRRRLGSDDGADGTTAPTDWRAVRARPVGARGGPYLAVHLRRRDFVTGRTRTVPSLETAAKAIAGALKRLGLDTVYLATDAPQPEVRRLSELLVPVTVVHQQQQPSELGAGQQAIVDQIVCSHARHFIGSYESTFSFRIQEERDMLGFAADSTFNRLCGDSEGDSCEQPTRWLVVYDDSS